MCTHTHTHTHMHARTHTQLHIVYIRGQDLVFREGGVQGGSEPSISISISLYMCTGVGGMNKCVADINSFVGTFVIKPIKLE